MGRRHSRPWRRPPRLPPPPPPPPVQLSIPNFPFPPRILNYLLSQGGGYNISFTAPNGSNGPLNVSAIQNPAAYDLNVPKQPKDNTVQLTSRPKKPPAYLTTEQPTPGPLPTNPSGPPNPKSNLNLPGNIPPIWVSAIRAMEFINNHSPVDTLDKLNTFYLDLAEQMQNIMGSGGNAAQNASAIIFFCTAISVLFKPFQQKFLYNYLNIKFPNIFVDSSAYQRVVIMYFFCNKLNKLFDYNPAIPGNGYIPINRAYMTYYYDPNYGWAPAYISWTAANDRVFVYVAPDILKEVIVLLQGKDPISNME